MGSFFWMELFHNLFRWIHVVAGILWIGLLYFFNFVNSAFAPTMDGETKKKVVPELMPRALFFFRWGAAFTWFSGVFLLALVFYHYGVTFGSDRWSSAAWIMIGVTFLGIVLYDPLAKRIKNQCVFAIVGLVLITAVVCAYQHYAGFSYRGVLIHTGSLFGTIMAFNVWFRIWPAQQKIMAAVKSGQAPDAALVGLAGLRSKHNTYLSVPLVWTMLNAHSTFLLSYWWSLPVIVALGWLATNHLYKIATKVKGI